MMLGMALGEPIWSISSSTLENDQTSFGKTFCNSQERKKPWVGEDREFRQGSLQLIYLQPDTGQCASKEAEPQRGWS